MWHWDMLVWWFGSGEGKVMHINHCASKPFGNGYQWNLLIHCKCWSVAICNHYNYISYVHFLSWFNYLYFGKVWQTFLHLFFSFYNFHLSFLQLYCGRMPKEREYCTDNFDFNLWGLLQMTCTHSLGVLSTICTSPTGWCSSVSHSVVSIEKQKFVHKFRSQTCSPHVKQDLILLWNAVRRRGRCWHAVVLSGKACKVRTLRCSLSPPLQGAVVEGSCTFWLVLN